MGGELSADVSASITTIYAQVIRRNVEPFIELLSKLVATPQFAEDEFARLKRETVAELIESRDNDRALAQRAFRRSLFGSHPYGRSSGGTVNTVEHLNPHDARKHYGTHFVKGNVVVGFSGDVRVAEAKRFGEQIVSGLGDGPALVDPVPPPSIGSGRKLVLVDKPERTQTQIVIGTLGTSPHDEDHVALSVANAVFGGTFTSRMMREIRSKRGWSYGTSSRLSTDRQRQAFSMWAFPAATDAPPCLKLELDLLETFVEKGVTPQELAFIKRYLVRSYAFEIDTAAKRLHQALDVELLGLPSDFYSQYVHHVQAVTVEEANRAVSSRISTRDLTIVVVGTASQVLEPLKASIPDLASHDVVPFDREE